MKYARLFVYTSLLLIAALATRWKMNSLKNADSGEVVSIDSIWAKNGKPVQAQLAKEERLPQFNKLSTRAISKDTLRAYVSLNTKERLKVGQDVYIFEGNKEKYKGELVYVSSTPEPVSGYYKLKIKFKEAKDISSGDHLIAYIVTGFGRPEIKIKRSALSIINNEYFVWVVDKDQRAHTRKVSADVIESTFVGVHKGLRKGETVITNGWSKLVTGDKVSIIKEEIEL